MKSLKQGFAKQKWVHTMVCPHCREQLELDEHDLTVTPAPGTTATLVPHFTCAACKTTSQLNTQPPPVVLQRLKKV